MQLFHLMTPLACGWEGRDVLGTDLPVTSSKCQRYVPELDLGFDAASPRGGKLTAETPALFKPLGEAAGGGVWVSIK